MPPISLVDLSKLPPLEKPVVKGKVSDKEMEEGLKIISQKRKRIRPVKRSVIREGDVLVADLEVKLRGSGKFIVKPVKSSAVELTSELELLPSFNSHLIGKKIGKYKFTLQIPSQYPRNPNLAGKELDCVVNVVEIRETYQYEPDDALAKELNFASLSLLKQALIPDIEAKRARKSEMVLRRNAIFALWKTQSVEAPPRMVDEELQQIKDTGTDEASKYSHKDVAEYRVQTGLLLNDFARRYGVRVSQDELEEATRNNSQFQQIPSEQVAAWLFEQKALEALISQCQVNEIEVTPEEFSEIENQDLEFLKSKGSKGGKAAKSPSRGVKPKIRTTAKSSAEVKKNKVPSAAAKAAKKSTK